MQAASNFWDGADTGADAQGGAGTWDTNSPNWDTASTGGADTNWANANNSYIAAAAMNG